MGENVQNVGGRDTILARLSVSIVAVSCLMLSHRLEPPGLMNPIGES